VVGIGMFGFTLSWDEIARTSQAIGDVNTLPLELQGLTTTVTTPAIYALGTVTTVVSFAVIRLIEPPIIEAFVARARREDFERLDALLDDEAFAREAGRRGDAIRLSGEFHLAIAARAGNRTLERMLGELVSRTSLVLMTYGPAAAAAPAHGPPGHAACHGEAHAALVDTMRAGGAGDAAREMDAHLRALEAALSFEVPETAGVDLVSMFGGAVPPPAARAA
jgi:DNA-binding FadR family transcriptional regulator